jgi:hypothetical protein
MTRAWIAVLITAFCLGALADTPPLSTVKSKTEDGAGTPINSANVSGAQGLDVNIINTSLPVTATIDASGLATSALQTTGNSLLTTLSGQLPSALGPQTMSNSLSVAFAANQTNIINTNAVLSARQTLGEMETVVAAPSNAVALIIECESLNADNVRWGLSSSNSPITSTTTGMLCEPGRSETVNVGAGTYLHITATGSGADYADIQWVLTH